MEEREQGFVVGLRDSRQPADPVACSEHGNALQEQGGDAFLAPPPGHRQSHICSIPKTFEQPVRGKGGHLLLVLALNQERASAAGVNNPLEESLHFTLLEVEAAQEVVAVARRQATEESTNPLGILGQGPRKGQPRTVAQHQGAGLATVGELRRPIGRAHPGVVFG